MTIYTLYIKTHKITGLKYLGQTKENAFKYNGSGKDWKSHLKKYGKEHYTEILRECQSKEELSNWGRYYSQYYNIINAQDDYGNKIWANRIPETGTGGQSNLSAESLAKRSASAKVAWTRKTTEDKDKRSANIRAARANMTPEAKAEHSALMSASLQAVWDNRTPEAKAKHSANIRAGKARRNSSFP